MTEKKIIHKDLVSGRWLTFSLMEQLANVGTDVARAIQWRNKGNTESSIQALERALELLDFTIADKKNQRKLRELVRVRATLADYFLGINEYSSTDESWQKYFFDFNYAAAVARGR